VGSHLLLDWLASIARLLANDGTRKNAVESIVASGDSIVHALLAWAQKPPVGVDKFGLKIELAETFGRLRTRAAIPFLIENITLQPWPSSPNTWMKTAEVIEERMPAVAALVQIGPEASPALIHTPIAGMTSEARLAAVFVVARIKNVPEARAFLTAAAGRTNLQRHWAEIGLRNRP
jgi:hypothetical protein